MNDITVDIQRKLGMIKASGYVVHINHTPATMGWTIIIGNDKKYMADLEEAAIYIDTKYKEIVQNESR